jgi:predicted RND superfamily exporter protein
MLLSRFLMLGVNHRLAAFLFLVVVTCAAGLGLPRLRVDTRFDSLIPDTDPDQQAYRRISREFGPDNRTIIYVRDARLWSPAKLAALEELHYALEGLRFVERVDDLFTLRTVRGTGGKIDARLVLQKAPKDQASADRARGEALSNPLVVGDIVSRDGTATALLLSIREAGDDPGFDRWVDESLERVLVPARSVFQEVFQVGPPRIDADLKAVLLKDLRVLGPLSACVLAAALLFFLRSLFAAWVPLVTAGLSVVWTLGMMGWTGIPLNILCAMLPSLVIVVGSTEDVYMLSSYFRGISQTQVEHRAFAVRFMMKHLGMALLLTILTIAMGFAANIFSSIGLIRSFALASTFAIVAHGVITVLFVPMVLSVMGPRRTRLFRDGEKVTGLPGWLFRTFGVTQRRLQQALLVITAILCAFFVYQLSKLYVTNDPLSYFKKDHPLIRDARRVHRDLSGMKAFFITLDSDTDKAFQEPRNIEKLVTIQRFLEKQGVFDRSLSLADHLALVNRELHGGDPEYFRIPERRELVAQYLLFFHRKDLDRYVSPDFRRANIVVRHDVSDSKVLNRYIGELKDVLTSVARGEITAQVVGESLMVNGAAESLMADQTVSLAVLLCAIFLIMSAMFTSFKGGVISLLPNLIPVIVMFGLMGLLGLPLNPGTVLVAVIVIGIAIDGTIHLISRYNELCRRTSNYEEALQVTIQEEAVPLVASYLALAVGFGILLLSDFNLIAQFGALSASTMIFALFANILITPIIMSRTRLVGLHQIWSLTVHKEVLDKSPLFQGMSNYQMRKAILISELNEFKEGDLLVKQGTFGRSMYVILAGRVEVVRRRDGRAQRIAVLGAGQVFGEVGYINEIERTADVRALTPVEALRFDYQKLRKDLKFFPHIVANLNFNISCILGERLAGALVAMGVPSEEEKSSQPGPSDDKGHLV